MQFKSILAILSVAFVATAIPLEQQAPRDLFERNSGGPTCTQAQANSLCTAAGNPITAASGIVGILAAILGIPIGDIVVGISNVACIGSNQANACCSNTQTVNNAPSGLIAVGVPVTVGTVCTPVNV